MSMGASVKHRPSMSRDLSDWPGRKQKSKNIEINENVRIRIDSLIAKSCWTMNCDVRKLDFEDFEEKSESGIS